MQQRIVSALAFAAGLIGADGAMAGGWKWSGFDGAWNVQLVTDSGICGNRSQTIAVENGRVRLVGASSATVTGHIGGNGVVKLGIRHSIAQADASGRLRANSGSGTWRASALGCSGRWTAQRRAAVAASRP